MSNQDQRNNLEEWCDIMDSVIPSAMTVPTGNPHFNSNMKSIDKADKTLIGIFKKICIMETIFYF